MTETIDISQKIKDDVARDGVSVIKATDGHVITFSLVTLERLVEKAKEKGVAIVFVKHPVTS